MNWKEYVLNKISEHHRNERLKRINTKQINDTLSYLRYHFTDDKKEELLNMITLLQNQFKNTDGGGLSGGIYIEMCIMEFFNSLMGYRFKRNNTNEADFSINNIDFSFKKISGKSIIALNWSKNKTKSSKEHFSSNIMLFIINTTQWWKKRTHYNQFIHSGIYVIDKYYCKDNVILTSNNKTDTLIKSETLFELINMSIGSNQYIPFPNIGNKFKTFSIINGFQ